MKYRMFAYRAERRLRGWCPVPYRRYRVRELTQIFSFDVCFRVINGAVPLFTATTFPSRSFTLFTSYCWLSPSLTGRFCSSRQRNRRFFTLVGNGDARQRQIDVFGCSAGMIPLKSIGFSS